VKRDIVTLLTEDLSVVLLSAGPDMATLSTACGGEILRTQLMESLEAAPDGPLANARISMLRDRTTMSVKDFEIWWKSRLSAATNDYRAAWLRLGAVYEVREVNVCDVPNLNLGQPSECRGAMRAGIRLESDTVEDKALLRAVLNGWCSDEPAMGQSEAAALLSVCRPQWFLGLGDSLVRTGHYWNPAGDRLQRSVAWSQLAKINDEYQELQEEVDSFFLIGEASARQGPACTLCRIHGPSWLAAEISVIAATRGDTNPRDVAIRSGEPLGPRVDYGSFIAAAQWNRSTHQWWADMYRIYDDALSRSTWVLAILSVSTENVVGENLTLIDAAVRKLTSNEFETLAASSSRIGVHQTRGGRLPRTLLATSFISDKTRLLLSHFIAVREHLVKDDPLNELSEDDLVRLAGPSPAVWPIIRAIGARLKQTPSSKLFDALARCGPEAYADRFIVDGMGKSELLELIAHPDRYPSSWVLAAERSYSSMNKEPIMREVAEEAGWIPRRDI